MGSLELPRTRNEKALKLSSEQSGWLWKKPVVWWAITENPQRCFHRHCSCPVDFGWLPSSHRSALHRSRRHHRRPLPQQTRSVDLPHRVVVAAVKCVWDAALEKAVVDDSWIQVFPCCKDPLCNVDESWLSHSSTWSEGMAAIREPVVPLASKCILHWLVHADVQWLQESGNSTWNDH